MTVKIAAPIEEVNQDVPTIPNPLEFVTTEQAGDIVSQEDIEKAMLCEQNIIRLKRMTTAQMIELGRWLRQVRDNFYYKFLGFDTLIDWLRSPQIDMPKSSAYRLMEVDERLIEPGIYTLDEVTSKSLYKLQIISQYATPENRLDHLLDLSREDFEVEIANLSQRMLNGEVLEVGQQKSKDVVTGGTIGNSVSNKLEQQTSGSLPANHEPAKQSANNGTDTKSSGMKSSDPLENAETVDFEEVPEQSSDDAEPEFSLDEFGLKGKFKLIPIKGDVGEEFVDFPDVAMKANLYIKQTTNGKEFVLEFGE